MPRIWYCSKECLCWDCRKEQKLLNEISPLVIEKEKVREEIEKTIVFNEGIDKYFPKGDKRRGEVLAILGLLNVELKSKLGVK